MSLVSDALDGVRLHVDFNCELDGIIHSVDRKGRGAGIGAPVTAYDLDGHTCQGVVVADGRWLTTIRLDMSTFAGPR